MVLLFLLLTGCSGAHHCKIDNDIPSQCTSFYVTAVYPTLSTLSQCLTLHFSDTVSRPVMMLLREELQWDMMHLQRIYCYDEWGALQGGSTWPTRYPLRRHHLDNWGTLRNIAGPNNVLIDETSQREMKCCKTGHWREKQGSFRGGIARTCNSCNTRHCYVEYGALRGCIAM